MVRRLLVLLLGRGSGKTTLAAAFAIRIMCTASLVGAGPGDIPTVVTIGPGRENAKLSVRMGLALVNGFRDPETAARERERPRLRAAKTRRPARRVLCLRGLARRSQRQGSFRTHAHPR